MQSLSLKIRVSLLLLNFEQCVGLTYDLYMEASRDEASVQVSKQISSHQHCSYRRMLAALGDSALTIPKMKQTGSNSSRHSLPFLLNALRKLSPYPVIISYLKGRSLCPLYR